MDPEENSSKNKKITEMYGFNNQYKNSRGKEKGYK